MKTFKINTNSWHYQLVRFDLDMQKGNDINFCKYVALVFADCLWLLGLFVAALSVALFIGSTIFPQDGFHPLIGGLIEIFAGVVFISSITTILGFIVVYGSKLIKPRDGKKTRVEKQPSFIRQAYSSWKNKYCMKIEFVNDDKDKL